MNKQRFFFIGIALLMACLMLSQDMAAAGNQSGSGYIGTTASECQRLIDAGNYAGAQRLALKLASSAQWKNGDLEAAGAIRAVVDAFRAVNRTDLANRVLQQAGRTHKATGDAAMALQGLLLPESARKALPVIDLTKSGLINTKEGALFNPATDLKRIRTGNQASVLKVMDAANKKVLYAKGLDGVLWAPVLETHRQAIFAALGISPASLDKVAGDLMKGYAGFSKKKECLALLSIIGSSEGSSLSDATRMEIQVFLVKTMQGSKDVVLRRQACLCIALQNTIVPSTVDAVVKFYEKSKNLWETFPVQQVFEYRKDIICQMPDRNQIKSRIAAIKQLYTANILKFL